MRQAKASASAMTVALARAHLHWLKAVDDPDAISVLTRRHSAAAWALRQRPLARYGTSPTFAYLAVRTRFFDDAVARDSDEAPKQVVIIGAGYDSRASRLAWPGVRYFEVDHPATQAEKRRRLPNGEVTYVPAVIGDDDLASALTASGYEIDRPAFFLVEGLTMYLNQAANEALFQAIGRLACVGSRLAADFASGGGSVALPSRVVASLIRMSWQLAGEQRYDWADQATALAILRSAGWDPVEVLNGPALATRYLENTTLRANGISPAAFCVLTTKT